MRHRIVLIEQEHGLGVVRASGLSVSSSWQILVGKCAQSPTSSRRSSWTLKPWREVDKTRCNSLGKSVAHAFAVDYSVNSPGWESCSACEQDYTTVCLAQSIGVRTRQSRV